MATSREVSVSVTITFDVDSEYFKINQGAETAKRYTEAVMSNDYVKKFEINGIDWED